MPGIRKLPALTARGVIVEELKGALGWQGSHISLSGVRYERMFRPGDRSRSLRWLERASKCAQAICRIDCGIASGTGFLVGPNPVLTNEHVVRGARPHRIHVHFTEHRHAGSVVQREVDEILFKEKHDQARWKGLDIALLRLRKPVPKGDRIYLPLHPVEDNELRPGRRAYIIGHPRNREIEVSLHGSEIVSFNDEVLQYETATESGSSGSPVFDTRWNVIGIHCLGAEQLPDAANPRKKRAANQGTRVDALMGPLRRYLPK